MRFQLSKYLHITKGFGKVGVKEMGYWGVNSFQLTQDHIQCWIVLFCYQSFTYLLTHSPSWALLEEPPIVQAIKNFPAFYGTWRFNTVFTRALRWSLSWATSIHSTPSHPTSLRSILILSTHLRLGLPSGLFSSGFSYWYLISRLVGYSVSHFVTQRLCR
jgi:hypothetical protein